MNCLACHTGKVAGRVVLGLPNSNYLLETLTEEVRLMKLKMGKPLTQLDALDHAPSASTFQCVRS